MRELTTYEKEKWYDQHNRFEVPEFIMHGDEIGDAYDALESAEGYDYIFDDEFVEALQVQILDMYYFQMVDWLDGGMNEEQAAALPSHESFLEKFHELGGDERMFASHEISKQAWDWAMDWRAEHLDEYELRRREQQLRAELARLEGEGGIVE